MNTSTAASPNVSCHMPILCKKTEMKIFIAFSILTILISCNIKTENKIPDLKKQKSNISSFDRGHLDYYFTKHEIKPLITVNNIEGNQTDVELSKHKIKWINNGNEIKIKIDNDLFTLKDKVTLNIVWDDKDSVDFANNWDEMKLYKINGRELIGIRMYFYPCTGLGCSVNYFIIYDLQTKTKNLFGTFRTENNLALYNFNNDNKINYLSKTFSGDAHGASPMEFIYELYSMENTGQFVQQKNSIGQPYQIKQTTYPNDTTKSDKFEQKWLTEIK